MMVRKGAEHEADAAFLQALGNSRDSLTQKTVMAQIGVRIEGYRCEKDHARFAQQVCGLHRDLESGIIQRPLGPLHPVNNALAVGVRITRSTDSNTRV